MTPQEKDLIATLLTRLKGAAGQQKDPEAEAMIRQAAAEMPDAPYYLVQTVLIQDLSLNNAQKRISELEQQVSTQVAKPATSFLGGLFGHSQPAAPPPSVAPGGPWARSPQVAGSPPPGYAPQPGYGQPGYGQPGYGQPGAAPAAGGGLFGGAGAGGGFLRSAAATAAGVAGGALLFEGISSMFGNHYSSSLIGGQMGAMPGLGESVVNNYYGDSGGQDFGGGGNQDSGGGSDYSGGGQDFAGGDFSGGQDNSGTDFGGGDFGGDSGGGDFGGGSDSSC